jgi:hypothetical protein
MSALRAEVPAATKQKRLFYLDWLRVLAVLGIFYYHTLRPFDSTSDWMVKNTDRSLVVTFFVAFFSTWGIPLLFLVAGAASWFALRSRMGALLALSSSLCPGFLLTYSQVGTLCGLAATPITSGFWPSSGCIACSHSQCSCSCEEQQEAA